MIGCIEEIALNNGWITIEDVHSTAREMGNSDMAHISKIGVSQA